MMVSFPFSNQSFDAYFVAPENPNQKYSAIILIHEVWGLKDHIKDVADRFCNQGYVVLAPDLLSQTGITEKIDQTILKEAQNPATRDEAQKKLREAMAPIQSPEFAQETISRLQACIDFLLQSEKVNGTIGVVGFCFGGTYAYALASADTRIKFAVPFYGHAPEEEKVASISCPVLAFYGEKDINLINDLPRVKEVMKKHDKQFDSIVYPNTGHAFFNDTNPTTYNKDAATDAWQKTLEFMRKNAS